MEEKNQLDNRTITCPYCNKTIELSKNTYQSLLKQIESNEITKKVNEQIELNSNKLELKHQQSINEINKQHNDEINTLITQLKDIENKLKIKDEQINSKIKEAEITKDKEINELKAKLNNLEATKKLEIAQKENELKTQHSKEILEYVTKQKNYQSIIDEKERKIIEIEQAKKEEIARIKEQKENEIKEIKEYTFSRSTKMIGESLESFCYNEFKKMQAIAYRNSIFGKDNDSSKDGTKGDFIFRDYTDDKVEVTSIMFEMKNENPDTKDKQKNEEFFKKLDKDRKTKKCEYAVLVTTLEKENDLYNQGIYIVPGYEKMYVVRPDFFINIIGIIRNASLANIEDKRQIKIYQESKLELYTFQQNVEKAKEKATKSLKFFNDRSDDVEKQIDNAIKALNAIKENYQTARKHLVTFTNSIENFDTRQTLKNLPNLQKELEFQAKQYEEENKNNEE